MAGPKITRTHRKGWELATWKCCGFEWSVVVIASMPKRAQYVPWCPKCKSEGVSVNEARKGKTV